MKLLVVEDNHWLAESIQSYLSKDFLVDIAETGEDALRKASSIQYAVIILDLNLPDMNGHDVCLQLRKKRITTPVLVLTGNKLPEDCVRLLDAGADDYLTKPFNRAELRARITALTRRRPLVQNAHLLKVNDLTIDVQRRHVNRSGTDITLRRKEFDILEYLVANRGRVVTRQMIIDHAWSGDQQGWNNTVDVHIKHLRDKVDRPFKPALIKTAYGIGYMVDDAAI